MTNSPLDRREFHTHLTGMAFAGLAAATPNMIRADDEPAEPEKEQPAEAEKPLSPAELVVELTKATFPHEQMTGDFLRALQSYVALNLSYSETLDHFGLTNADPLGTMA